MDANPARPHIVITGLMGVGKSTTAQALAAELGRPTRDSDTDIQALFAVSGSAFAADQGVDELHTIESAVLLGALASPDPTVISAAAWVVEDPHCRRALANRATVIVLHAPVDEVLARIATGTHRRPMDRAELEALAARRAPLFEDVADLVCDAAAPPDELVARIIEALRA